MKGWIAGIGLLALLIGVAGRQVVFAPANAVVYANPATELYMSPPCFRDGNYTLPLPEPSEFRDPILAGLEPMTKSDAGSLGLKSDKKCDNAGGFIMEKLLITAPFLDRPLTKPRRWNEDGSWNW